MRSRSAEDREGGWFGWGGVLVTRSGPVNGTLCLFCLQPERLAGEEMAGAQTGQETPISSWETVKSISGGVWPHRKPT